MKKNASSLLIFLNEGRKLEYLFRISWRGFEMSVPSFDWLLLTKETLQWLFRMFWWKSQQHWLCLLWMNLRAEAFCIVFILWLLLLLFSMHCQLLSLFSMEMYLSVITLFVIYGNYWLLGKVAEKKRTKQSVTNINFWYEWIF